MKNASHQSEQDLRKFFMGGRRFAYKHGEIILRGDDTPQGVYLIEEGFVKVYSITKHGNENIRIILKPGELFSVIWALKGSFKNVFFEALGPASLRRVSREEFLKFTSTQSGSRAVIDNLINLFSAYAARIDNLEFNYSTDRVAYLLLLLMKRLGEPTKQGIVLNAPINHKIIADSISLARETTSRVMSRLEQKGIISNSGRKIIILKPEELKRYFE